MNELIAEIKSAAQMIASPNCADRLSIILSLASIVIGAIVALVIMHKQNQIAKRQVEISEQQNSISLFDLRYNTYNRILDCNHFAKMIALRARKDSDILFVYRTTILKNSPHTQTIEDNCLVSEMMDFVSELGKAEFLFSIDIAKYAAHLQAELIVAITNCLVLKENYIEDAKSSLNKTLRTYDVNKICDKMVTELQLVHKPNQVNCLTKRG